MSQYIKKIGHKNSLENMEDNIVRTLLKANSLHSPALPR